MSEVVETGKISIWARSSQRSRSIPLLVKHDCRVWYVSLTMATILWLIPLVVAGIVALSLTNRPVFRFLTKEDGPIEWAQAGGFFATAVLSMLVARLFLRTRAVLPLVLYVLLGLGCLFIAGEEISWGQRLFGIATPPELAEVNLQGETTLHNVSQAHPFFRAMYLLIGLYGGIAVIVTRLALHRVGRTLPHYLNLVMPPLFLTSSFLVLFGYRLARVLVFQEPRFVVVKYGEVAEFSLAFALAAFTLLTYRRLKRSHSADGRPLQD